MTAFYVEFTQSRTRTIRVEDAKDRADAEKQANAQLDTMVDPFGDIEKCETARVELTSVHRQVELRDAEDEEDE